MGYNFRDYNPNQLLLLAPNLDDWLPQQHLARFRGLASAVLKMPWNHYELFLG